MKIFDKAVGLMQREVPAEVIFSLPNSGDLVHIEMRTVGVRLIKNAVTWLFNHSGQLKTTTSNATRQIRKWAVC